MVKLDEVTHLKWLVKSSVHIRCWEEDGEERIWLPGAEEGGECPGDREKRGGCRELCLNDEQEHFDCVSNPILHPYTLSCREASIVFLCRGNFFQHQHYAQILQSNQWSLSCFMAPHSQSPVKKTITITNRALNLTLWFCTRKPIRLLTSKGCKVAHDQHTADEDIGLGEKNCPR